MPRPLLIGQAPGPRTNPDTPLWPAPPQSGGGRLFTLTGMTTREYLRTFDRMNLLREFPGRWRRDDRWPRREARIAAQAVEPLLKERVVIFVGRNVATAFDHGQLPWFEWTQCGRWGYAGVVIPHPSGRNHWYNREGNRLISQEFWEKFRRGLPFCNRPDMISSVA